MNKKKTTIDDATIVAFLSLKGYQIKPIKQMNGRVSFEVYGDVEKALNELYDNCQVGILDFIKALKTVRNSIFLLKSL